MEDFFNYNGRKLPVSTPIFGPASRAFRFGDSLFETMRINKGEISLFGFHIDRLLSGMKLLEFEMPPFLNAERMHAEILSLAQKNKISEDARVRLTIFRQDGGLYDPVSNLPQYVIECSTLPLNYSRLNENGFVIDILPGNRKGSGPLSNLKSGNYLIYIMAAQYAKQIKCNECLVLNENGRLADSSIFNLFIVKDGLVTTPALGESPVAGVMRRHLIEAIPALGYQVREAEITPQDIESADEVFLSNALYRIRWVKEFRNKKFENNITSRIYSKLFQQNGSTFV